MALQAGQTFQQEYRTVRDADGREVNVDAGGIAQSLVETGTAAAPGVGAILVGHTPPAGVYRLKGVILLTGTAETALRNLQVFTQGAVINAGGRLPTISGVAVPFEIDRVVANGTNAINLLVTAAATAGSIYTASLIITRVE